MPTLFIRTDQPLPERKAFDFYPTPTDIVEMALSMLDPYAPNAVLDLCAGLGAWGDVARQKWPHAHIAGIEIRPVGKPVSYDEWHTENVLTYPMLPADLVMGNPPFGMNGDKRDKKMATKCVFRALELSHRYVSMLLPLAFLAGKERAQKLYAPFPPRKVKVIGRVSFYGENTTDLTDYALYLWEKGYTGKVEIVWP